MKTLEQIKEIISQYDELISLVGGKIKVAQKADYFLYNTHRCIESITFENDLVL